MPRHHPDPEERPARIPPGPPPRTAVGNATLPPGRRYLVVRGADLVGRSRLEYPLEQGMVAAGRFHPGPGWEAVRGVFSQGRAALARGDATLLRRYQHDLEVLELGIRDQWGAEMDGTVDLISEWEDGRIILHVTLPDRLYWERLEAGEP